MVMDSAVRCERCGNEALVNFSHCLQHGWPKCCGTTMVLAKTTASIEDAVSQSFGPLNATLREERRS